MRPVQNKCRAGLLGTALWAFAIPGAAMAQEPWKLQDETVQMPVDLCEIVKTCMPAAELGLPQDTPSFVIPDWGVAQLKAMRKGGLTGDRIQGYAEGLSAKTRHDWCDECKCCFIRNGAVGQPPDPALTAEFFKEVIVVEGQ